eukprot:359213-Chlamydomonas_euryale.AAC.2
MSAAVGFTSGFDGRCRVSQSAGGRRAAVPPAARVPIPIRTPTQTTRSSSSGIASSCSCSSSSSSSSTGGGRGGFGMFISRSSGCSSSGGVGCTAAVAHGAALAPAARRRAVIAAAAASPSSAAPAAAPLQARVATVKRETKETQVSVTVNLDGTGKCVAKTPVHFLNHMLDQISSHGLIDLEVHATGDTWIDDHHTVEDIALAFGGALSQALGDRKGIHRFGEFSAPLDEVRTSMRLWTSHALLHVRMHANGHASVDQPGTLASAHACEWACIRRPLRHPCTCVRIARACV